MDETEYLLASPANARRLREALEQVRAGRAFESRPPVSKAKSNLPEGVGDNEIPAFEPPATR